MKKNVVGIIAEFNPFHDGHAYLISEAKRLAEAECAIVVMSGDFVQRGEPAVCDKYLRTEMALNNGADIVLELPVTYATGSAGRFAEGAVRLLAGLGCVTHICFGSECGDIERIGDIADILANEPDVYKMLLQHDLKMGMSYPAARAHALTEFTNDAELAGLLEGSNNILAIEYCVALKKIAADKACLTDVREAGDGSDATDATDTIPGIRPITIARQGSDYNDGELPEKGYCSATALRKAITDTYEEIRRNTADKPPRLRRGVSKSSGSLLNSALGTLMPITADDLSGMLYIRLNTVTRDELEAVEGMTPDLADRLWKFREEPIRWSEFVPKVKTKNITYSAISRALLHLVLGMEAPAAGTDTLQPGYARLLGFRQDASGYLRTISDLSTVRLITKPADEEGVAPGYATDVRVAMIYEQLIMDKFGTAVTGEMRRGPIRL